MCVSSTDYLVIPDIQEPFGVEKGLDFCRYVQRHYKIPKENILCVGDEVDNLNGGMYEKDPDALHSPMGELKEAKERIAMWVDAFPIMRVAISNHGLRWIKKASHAEIPSILMRTYQEVLGIPDTWKYAMRWKIDTKHPFDMVHGMQYSGKTPYRGAGEKSTRSVVFGHLHSSAGICYIKTDQKSIWAMNAGSLIDREAYAFKYGRDHEYKACNGAAIVAMDGKMPIWLPFD